MSNTDDDKFVKDPRILCKYGIKCYQKNPNHHEKYKHPPKTQNVGAAKHSNKKLKAETTREVKEVVTKCDVSDSDDYDIEDNSSTGSDNELEKQNSSLSDDNENKNKKITISNDVSDSDDTDAEATKEVKTKDNNMELHTGKLKAGENEKTEKVKVTVSASVSDSDDADMEAKKEKHTTDNDQELNSPSHKESKKAQKEVRAISNPKTFIKEKFLVDMPEDFYQFWEFCNKIKPKNPSEALMDVGLLLVGPFDVLMGKFNTVNKSDDAYLIHWRYYHDPPEFQTVLKGDDNTGYHIGYFRDSPEELPVILASNCAKRDGVLHQMGGNIFSAVSIYLDELKKSGDPFKKMQIGKIQSAVKKEAERLKLELSHKTDSIISREKKIVTRTFNKIGLVVPYDRKTQLGYRELALDNKELAMLLTKLQKALPEQKSKFLSDLQPVFTYASIATDECDFGTGIELGWNIIAHGVDSLDSTALRSLTTNYHLLNRDVFAKIAEAHLKNRKKGCDLSIV